MKVYKQGFSAPVNLRDDQVRGQPGGEGTVYVVGAEAYKVYHDSHKSLSPKKIDELRKIVNPNVIKPELVLLNEQHQTVGYTMRAIDKARPLIAHFTKTFKDREGLSDKHLNEIYSQLWTLMQSVHDANCLIVDPNEMNYLVSIGFDQVFAIDTDSYQTPSFPGTAVLPNVRDFLIWPLNSKPKFTSLSDWYGFGTTTFQLYMGVHPYRGSHPTVKDLESRASKRISVFDSSVKLPAFLPKPENVIPSVLLAWYKAVFQEGKREIAPKNLNPVVKISTVSIPIVSSVSINAKMIWSSFEGIRDLYNDWAVLSDRMVNIRTKKEIKVTTNQDTKAATVNPYGNVFQVSEDRGVVTSYSVVDPNPSKTTLYLEDFIVNKGRLLGRQGGSLVEGAWNNSGSKLESNIIGTCMPSAVLFRNCVFQTMMGTPVVCMNPVPGFCYQAILKELKGYRIIEAELNRNILQVVTSKNGSVHRWVFKFDAKYDKYVSIVNDITSCAFHGINFAVLDSGVVVEQWGDNDLKMYSSKPENTTEKILQNTGVYTLYSTGTVLLGVANNCVYELSMTK
jgi:hypothetical protein